MQENPSAYIAPGPTIESDNPAIVQYSHDIASGTTSPRDAAVRLYYEIRDAYRYDPYTVALDTEGLKATRTFAEKRGWCVSKAIMLAAVCRAQNIPARLGFADVRNHLSTEKMRQQMQTDLFYWHGYTSIYLDDQWVKATPAFNIELCEKFGLKPLEFDGTADSIYHPFDNSGNRHMEYVNFRGEFAETPIDDIRHTFETKYPHWRNGVRETEGDFDADVMAEVRS